MKAIVVVGNDKIGRRLVSKISDNSDISVLIDHSSGLSRIYKILLKRRIGIKTLLLMGLAEMMRRDTAIPDLPRITSNADLATACKKNNVKRVFLFRAGLIISRELLDQGFEIINMHCARLPEYGGLASIHKALVNKDYDQCATLHIVTEGIDKGEIIRTLPFKLDPKFSYKKNEDTAYEAGITLLSHYLKNL